MQGNAHLILVHLALSLHLPSPTRLPRPCRHPQRLWSGSRCFSLFDLKSGAFDLQGDKFLLGIRCACGELSSSRCPQAGLCFSQGGELQLQARPGLSDAQGRPVLRPGARLPDRRLQGDTVGNVGPAPYVRWGRGGRCACLHVSLGLSWESLPLQGSKALFSSTDGGGTQHGSEPVMGSQMYLDLITRLKWLPLCHNPGCVFV